MSGLPCRSWAALPVEIDMLFGGVEAAVDVPPVVFAAVDGFPLAMKWRKPFCRFSRAGLGLFGFAVNSIGCRFADFMGNILLKRPGLLRRCPVAHFRSIVGTEKAGIGGGFAN